MAIFLFFPRRVVKWGLLIDERGVSVFKNVKLYIQQSTAPAPNAYEDCRRINAKLTSLILDTK
jgi:hypothetical protein